MLLRRNEEGFSLIELAVVLAIISIIIALIVPKMIKQADRAKEKRAKAEITLMKSIIDSYFVEHGTYPKAVNSTDDSASIEAVLVKNGIDWGSVGDPWGNGYKYDTDNSCKKYTIYSIGSPDSDKGYIIATYSNTTITDQTEPATNGTTVASK